MNPGDLATGIVALTFTAASALVSAILPGVVTYIAVRADERAAEGVRGWAYLAIASGLSVLSSLAAAGSTTLLRADPEILHHTWIMAALGCAQAVTHLAS